MIVVPPERLPDAADVFAAAMWADPLHGYFFPDGARRLARLSVLFRFMLSISAGCLVATSPALEGCAHWVAPRTGAGVAPGRVRLSHLALLLQSIPLTAFIKMIGYDRFARALHHQLIPQEHWYLNAIAVAPDHQGQGYAGQLIRPILAQADAAGLPCYLETQNQGNLPIYACYGFRLAQQSTLPGSRLAHFAMLRDPR